MLFSPNSRTFGLEISDDAIRAMAIRQGYFGLAIEGVAELPLAKSPWLKNGIRHKEELAEQLKHLVATAQPKPITQSRCLVALPEDSVFSKVIQLPKLPRRELVQTIPFEAAEFLPLPLEEMYLDWQIDETSPKTTGKPMLQVLAVAAPRRLVDELIETLTLAELTVSQLESQPFSLCRSLQHTLNHTATTVMFHLDERSTTFIMAEAAAIKLTATIPVGSHHLRLDLKRHCQTLADEVTDNIKYYHNRLGATQPAKHLYLSGQGATLKGLRQALAQATGLQCHIGHSNIQLPTRQPIDPRFNVVLGLALGDGR